MFNKKCRICSKIKKLKEFNKHKLHFDGYDSRCRECQNGARKLLDEIKKNAPEKTDICQCCGQIPTHQEGMRTKGLVCDHDHETNQFRGWICRNCNHGIGKLGDNIEGLKQALRYLEQARDNNDD